MEYAKAESNKNQATVTQTIDAYGVYQFMENERDMFVLNDAIFDNLQQNYLPKNYNNQPLNGDNEESGSDDPTKLKEFTTAKVLDNIQMQLNMIRYSMKHKKLDVPGRIEEENGSEDEEQAPPSPKKTKKFKADPSNTPQPRVATNKAVASRVYMYNDINLLAIEADTPTKYGCKVVDVMFTKHELADCVILTKGKKRITDRASMDEARLVILKNAVKYKHDYDETQFNAQWPTIQRSINNKGLKLRKEFHKAAEKLAEEEKQQQQKQENGEEE